MKFFLVFDVGGSSIKFSIIDNFGKIYKSDKTITPKTLEGFLKNIEFVVNETKKEYEITGIALSLPGAVDSDKGVILGASALPYIHGPNIKNEIFNITKINCEIENDANCAALGECWIGNGKDKNDLAFVVCGTGIGGAIVKDKRIHKGIHLHGGEFGFAILDIQKNENEDWQFKSWSRVGSTIVMAQKICEAKNLPRDSIDGVKAFELYENGDEIARREVNAHYFYMATGIYNLQYIYDPEIIILGGAISEREDYINQINIKLDIIFNQCKDSTIKPIITTCKFGNDSNKLGALYHYLTKNDML